jgi:pimeloyl-ACP methyl ester carboxylesterase
MEVSMHRPLLSLAAVAALILTACATTDSRHFTSDRISVVTRGSGPDVILIPGLAGSPGQWAGVAETLDDRYRLHLVQVNGFAGVPAGPNAEGPVAAPVADEIARYIMEARLRSPAVIGHSMGGSIGMMLTARHPDLVGRLMVVDMMPFMGEMFAPGATPDALRAMAEQLRAGILAAPPGEGMLGQMFPTMTSRSEMVPKLMEGVRASDRRTVANAFQELIVTDLRPELAHISAPVTVLYVVPPNVPLSPAQFDAAMAGLYASLPGVRLVRIDDSRHFIYWDQPERFVSEVNAFMKPLS